MLLVCCGYLVWEGRRADGTRRTAWVPVGMLAGTAAMVWLALSWRFIAAAGWNRWWYAQVPELESHGPGSSPGAGAAGLGDWLQRAEGAVAGRGVLVLCRSRDAVADNRDGQALLRQPAVADRPSPVRAERRRGGAMAGGAHAPGDAFFEVATPRFYVPLRLRNPTAVDVLSTGRGTLPAWLEETTNSLERSGVRYILWAPSVGLGKVENTQARSEDVLQPMREYVRMRFTRVAVFRGRS
jgi:hypothetical protein